MTAEAPGYLYARQFVAGPRPVSVANLLEIESFGGGFTICRHSGLALSRAAVPGREVVCLGHILDPRQPSRQNAEILDEVVGRSQSFAELEAELAGLGGRWLLFCRIGEEARLYPDAVGTRSAFYAVRPNGEVWVGSQPRVLLEGPGGEIDHRVWDDFLSAPVGDSWPASITPYVGVRQLLPNHWLDLKSGETRRFWPRHAVPRRDLEEAAARIADMLHRMMAALLQRGTAGMSMTAGYDSRTLLACAGELRDRLTFFVLSDPAVSWHDVWLPRKITRKLGQSVRAIRTRPFDKEFWATLQQNVGGMWWDPADHRIYSFGAVRVRFLILSLMSEVARCFHYKDGVHPTAIGPELLASLSRYPGNRVAIAAFAEWLADVPEGTNVSTLDLFFWENRLGNWASMLFTAMDAVTEVVNPYNCRELLEIGLGVDLQYRCSPYRLHRRICEIAAPVTLSVPFNHMWQEDVYSRVAPWIPWRVRAGALRVTMRALGFDWPRAESPTRGR
jgi:hypothetical protein